MDANTPIRIAMLSIVSAAAVFAATPLASAWSPDEGVPLPLVQCNPSSYEDRLGLGYGAWVAPTKDGCAFFVWCPQGTGTECVRP